MAEGICRVFQRRLSPKGTRTRVREYVPEGKRAARGPMDHLQYYQPDQFGKARRLLRASDTSVHRRSLALKRYGQVLTTNDAPNERAIRK